MLNISKRTFWWGLGIVVFISAIILAWAWISQKSATVDAAIREIGFYPITPPTADTSVGSIYHITNFGTQYGTICRVSKDLLLDKLRYSPTEKVVAEKLVKASGTLKGQLLETIKQAVNFETVSSIKYRLVDVEVGEVSLADLAEIATNLQAQPHCTEQIERLIRAGEFVCQAHVILRASAEYSVNFKEGLSGSAEVSTDPIIRGVRDQIRANLDPTADVSGKKVRSGKGLHYGIRVTPLCMTLPDAPARVKLPSTKLGWLWHSVRQALGL